MQPEFVNDTVLCTTDERYEDVVDTYNRFKDLINTVLADDDYKDKIIGATDPHQDEILQDGQDAATEWGTNDYYGAGADIGKIAKIALSPWIQEEAAQFL